MKYKILQKRKVLKGKHELKLSDLRNKETQSELETEIHMSIYYKKKKIIK